jgi:hypothetical protein
MGYSAMIKVQLNGVCVMKSMKSKISIIILSLMACTFTFAEDKPAEEWLFVHTADEAQVTNSTTIVMPVTRDIFAFTDRPYRKHDYMTGEQFAALWTHSGSNSFKSDPPNAVLTWVDGEEVKEAEVVITGASSDGKMHNIHRHRQTQQHIRRLHQKRQYVCGQYRTSRWGVYYRSCGYAKGGRLVRHG